MTIISFCRGFIFVKNYKTAGTSIEVHLSQQCAENDIVTPIFPENPCHRPRNHQDRAGRSRYYNHMPAREIRDLRPLEFTKFYKFCFERHPVEKCLSDFAMLLNSPLHQRPDNAKDWNEYLAQGRFPVDAARYTDDRGNLLVDRIYRFEQLDAALADISAITGITHRPLRAREKAGFRFNVPGFEDVMARPSQRKLIFDAFTASLRFVDYS